MQEELFCHDCKKEILQPNFLDRLKGQAPQRNFTRYKEGEDIVTVCNDCTRVRDKNRGRHDQKTY